MWRDWPTPDEECLRCHGSGCIELRDWRTGYPYPIACPDCNGTGYRPERERTYGQEVVR